MTTILKLPLGLLLMAGLLFIGGCSEEDEITGDGNQTAVRFNAGITATTRTTNGGDSWKQNDPVGVFMLKTGGTFSKAADIEASNVKYTVNASNGELTTSTPIYYPTGGAAVDFIAYYPYSNSITDDYKYDISVAGQSDPAAIDVLYAKVQNKNQASGAVSLGFDHVLSKVTFNVKHGTGFDAPTIAGLTGATIAGMPASASMALQDGAVTAGANGNIGMLKATTAADGYDATFSAIIVPRGSGAGRKVVFTIGGIKYEGTLPNDDVFEKGNHYTYPVTVNETGVVFGTPSIGRWTSTPRNTSEATEINIETVFIKAGTFTMGSPAGESGRFDDETQHQVTLTRDFYMSKHEITNAQYAAFLNAVGVGYESGSGYYETATGGRQLLIREHQWGLKYDNDSWKPQAGYENYPVVNVTWYGADEFARWIGGSLPTEAQWEYACRAGTTTTYSYWDHSGTGVDETLGNYAWYDSNSRNATHEVGAKAANPWGLYDMHGNVYEWCSDWYDYRYYNNSPDTDPTGPDTGSERVLRGGGWYDLARRCRSAFRYFRNPGDCSYTFGFRVVFVL
ncbi:SUMF1/EgtB/PvdO family nonheme iron enzyme [uncultured Sanguibacteroides sp.]|uniref:SUMF1/EgtB/PvdO family nonheme iron enzyme n=1 Tax=uncultured Sanguibacteroides sp. TaxID=1635151 RepID=UPI0025D699C3|nr:SUMF1/EgtB/PvdO family nonheme iron enzyme [uncultured Sanguibacteroides sp.]